MGYSKSSIKQLSGMHLSSPYKFILGKNLRAIVDEVVPSSGLSTEVNRSKLSEFMGLRFSSISTKSLIAFFKKGIEESYHDAFWKARAAQTTGLLAEGIIELRDNYGVVLSYSSLRMIVSFETITRYAKDYSLNKELRQKLQAIIDNFPDGTSYNFATIHLTRMLGENSFLVGESIQEVIRKHSCLPFGIETLIEINNSVSFIPVEELVERLEKSGIACSGFYHLFSLEAKGILLDSAMGL